MESDTLKLPYGSTDQCSAGREVKPILTLCVCSSQDESLLLPKWKGFSVVSLLSNDWLNGGPVVARGYTFCSASGQVSLGEW